MNKPQNPIIPKEYAEKFRQNQPNMGTGNTRGAPVAPPCKIKHFIGNAGAPEKRGA